MYTNLVTARTAAVARAWSMGMEASGSQTECKTALVPERKCTRESAGITRIGRSGYRTRGSASTGIRVFGRTEDRSYSAVVVPW